jgi:hypothetical protein
MQEAAASALGAWRDFYVIAGTAAAALTGLTFVALTLVAGARRTAGSGGGIGAFSTPTVVHFGAALLVAALLSAPWRALWHAGLLLGLAGLAGLAYAVIVVRRLRRPVGYRPVLHDWLWHGALPLAAYITLLVAAIALPRQPVPALFGIGGVTVLLLIIGIHNTWDGVTYIVIELMHPEE